jgi:hypothetical protein
MLENNLAFEVSNFIVFVESNYIKNIRNMLIFKILVTYILISEYHPVIVNIPLVY